MRYVHHTWYVYQGALLGETFLFVGFRYRRSENWDFRLKKKSISTANCLFSASSEIIEKIIILKHHSASVNYVTITIMGSMSFFFFPIAHLKNFS